MNPLPLIGLWCLATAVSILAAEPSADATPLAPSPSLPAPTLVAGPWLLLGEDGVLRCGMEFSGTLDPTTVQVHCGSAIITTTVAVRPFQVANHLASQVVEITLPVTSGTWRVSIPGRQLDLTVAPPPTRTDPSRVVVAGPNNWPRATDLAAFAERAGGPVQLVVAYGLQSTVMLGSGGWENTVPVVILPQPISPWVLHVDDLEVMAQARLGALSKQWMSGTRCGGLGLPWAADPASAAKAIARDLSPWEVCLVPSVWWELGLLAPRISRQAAGTAPLIDLCLHLQVPVILTLGSGASWVSDPLSIEGDRVRSQAGGVRVIAATPAGDGLGLLPVTVASVIDEPGIIGLVADSTHLQVLGLGFSGANLLQLEVRREGIGFIGDGVGRIELADHEAVALRTQWLTDDDAGKSARASSRWLPTHELTTLHVESPDVLALLAASEKVPAVIPLLRRLTGVEDVVANGLSENQAALPALVLRDLLLRYLARPESFDPTPWLTVIATTTDPVMLSAILRAHQDGVSPAMLDLLVARVQAQAAGTTPIEADALLQHRLMSAVFDAANLSPTILRPLAVALRPKLTPFTGGPVERFIGRHGEVRR